jgi:hypothetical protein
MKNINNNSIPYCNLREWYYILMRALEKELENDGKTILCIQGETVL